MIRRMVEAIKYIIKDPKDWVRVCLKEVQWTTEVSFGEEVPFKIWFHLYENSVGVRRFEVHYSNEKDGKARCHKQDSFYINSVIPWSRGVHVKGIDSYSIACQQMIMDELAGK